MLLYIFAVVYLVVHHPAHVFEVAIIEKCRTVELHPQTQLLHTDGADFWKHIAAQAHTQNQIHCSLKATLKPQMSEKCSKFTDIFSEKLLWRWCPSCSLSPSSSPAAWRARGNPSDMIHSRRAQIQFFSTQPKWHRSYLCDLLLYSLQLQCAFLSHRLRPLHLIQFLSVLNADAQAQSHARQRAQQLHRLTGMSRARPHSTD